MVPRLAVVQPCPLFSGLFFFLSPLLSRTESALPLLLRGPVEELKRPPCRELGSPGRGGAPAPAPGPGGGGGAAPGAGAGGPGAGAGAGAGAPGRGAGGGGAR